MYLATTFNHQYSSFLPINENAVPVHHYSSSEGSDAQSYTAPAAGDAFISDGSGDSSIGPLAVNDTPYLPPRLQPAANANPSPLNYSIPPDYVSSQPGHSVGRNHFRNYSNGYINHAHNSSYAPQYQHRTSYEQASSEGFGYWDDPPYIPPGYTPPPPLALQTQRHFARLQNIPTHAPPPPPPHPLIAPQVAYDLPSSPSSSESSVASLGPSYSHNLHQPHPHYHPHHHHNQLQTFPPSPPPVQLQHEPPQHILLSPSPVEALGAPEDRRADSSQSPVPEPPKEEEVPRSRQWHETDKYLRNQIGIPDGTRVDLWALPDPPSGQKPQQPLPILVKLAIHGSEKGMLTLQEIYQSLEERFEYFERLKSSAWKNSIRHNLSLNQVFRSCDRPITEPGKGRYWSVDISKGEGYKRERRRKRRNAAPYNGTRDLPGGVGNQLTNQADSSDGDQEMEDVTSAPADATTSKATTTTKKVKGAGRRGPYTRVTVGQPSVPGSTGVIPGPAGTSASPSPDVSAPTGAPLPAMVFPESAMPSLPMDPCTASTAEPNVTSASLQAPNTMHDVGAPDPSAITRPFYQSAYGFTRAAMPTFGQPSLTAPATFNVTSRSMIQPGTDASYTSSAATAILISSDSGSDSEGGGGMANGYERDVQMGV